MPSWDIALCHLVNDELLHDAYLAKWPFVLLCLRDKFRYQPHVHIVFHLASRLLLPLVPRRQQMHSVRTLSTCITGASCSLVSLLDASYISVPGKGRCRHFAPSFKSCPILRLACTMGVELPIISFLSAFLLVLILPAPIHYYSIPSASLIAWLFFCNLIHGINSVVWNGNQAVHASAWCDICKASFML